MQMQIRALRDLYLQKDRLVQNFNVVAMSRGADARGIDTLAYTSCPYVICLLYTFNTCFEIISGFMTTFSFTNHYINVCFIRYIINKSQRFFYISFLFMFFKCYITISYCID